MKNSVNKPYWASVGAKEIADNILEKVDNYYEYLSMSGRLDLWRRSWAYYYRPRIVGGMINPAGQQGELTALSINHYRNLLVHLETMTMQQKAAFEPRATNSDMESQSQVILAAGLLDYYMKEKSLQDHIKQAVKDCLIFSEGFIRAEWDATSGEIYGVTATGAPQREGDIKYSNYTPLDTIRDYTKLKNSKHDWKILRDWENKYELSAKFPELEEKILNDYGDYLKLWRTTTLNFFNLEESDNIPVYTLLHPPTPAMPNGRYTQVLDNGTVLMDGPLPYKETHLYRIAPDEETGTIFGYTVGFDLLPVQECIDILYSTVVTNQSTFGVQNVLVPKGHDLSTSQMTGGLNVVEYDPKVGKPEAMNLTGTPAEIFNFIGQLEQLSETLSGVNSVARGNPESSLKSGAALALVQSMAIQFSMNLQQSYAALVESIGTGTINILKEYAAVPRVAEISGKSNRPLMKQFSGKDLGSVNRVTVDMGNALTRTTAGKVNLADAFLEKGMISNPDQYIQVVNTGRLEPVIEGKQAQLLLIKAENEGLSDGAPQRAVITDNHAQHILEHGVVLSSPEARANPNSPIAVATLNHIQEHLTMAQSPGYQMIAQMLGHQLMAPPSPLPGDGGTGDMLSAAPPVVQDAQNVNQPNMPSPPQGADQMSAEVIEAQQGAPVAG